MPLWWSSRMMKACMTTHSWWPVSSCSQSPENAELSYKTCVWCTHDALCLCLWHGSVLPVPQPIECRQATVYYMSSTRLQHNFCLSVYAPSNLCVLSLILQISGFLIANTKLGDSDLCRLLALKSGTKCVCPMVENSFIQPVPQPRLKHFLCLVFYGFWVDWSVGHTNVDGNTWGFVFIYNDICAFVYICVCV